MEILKSVTSQNDGIYNLSESWCFYSAVKNKRKGLNAHLGARSPVPLSPLQPDELMCVYEFNTFSAASCSRLRNEVNIHVTISFNHSRPATGRL